MVEVSLRTGSKGVFDVSLDGSLIFSKSKLRRFPDKGEIVRLAEPVLGPPMVWRKSPANDLPDRLDC
jgi:predicted Rdx family selenoprotein